MPVIASSTSRRSATLVGLAALAAAVALTGCAGSDSASPVAPVTGGRSSAAPTMGPQAGTPTAVASTAVPTGSHLSPQAFEAAASTPGTVILDVRTAEEFAAGHLPGAINADVESPDFTVALAGLDPAASYAVYCQSGRRSGIALDELSSAGFADAYDLAGGISAWAAEGGQVVSGT